MRSLPSLPHLDDISLVDLCRISRKRIPESERPYYDAYLSHIGRKDFIKAGELSEQRFREQLFSCSSPSTFKIIHQAYSWHSKVTLTGDLAAEERAYEKYLRCEEKCLRMNKKLSYVSSHPHRARKVLTHLGWFDINRIRNYVSKIFGDFERGYPQILRNLEYGTGMSLSSRSCNSTSKPFKLSDVHSCTSDALPVWRDFLSSYVGLPGYVDWIKTPDGLKWRERVEIVPGCKITFVDKTSVIKRTIAIEPSANVSMQLAVHRYLAKRLEHLAGIDIKNQNLNRDLALKGSLTGDFATIDLSSASDSVSIELVRLLLPPLWFELLDALRSKEAMYKGSSSRISKFSSMGNGFTFALETVLFYAIAQSASDSVRSQHPAVAYGDDIIVGSESYTTTVGYLTSLGFSVNYEKSFFEGPFRESCGLDAFSGVNVRPVFLRRLNLTLVERYAFHNLCYSRGLFEECDIIVSSIPPRYRLFGPPGPNDGVLHTEDPVLLGATRTWDKKYQRYRYSVFKTEGLRCRYSSFWLLEASLNDGGIYSSGAPLRYRTRLVRSTALL